MEEIPEEPHRRSMFEVSKEIRESKQSVSRLMYVGRINVERSPKIDLADEFSKWLKESESFVTGLLITTGNYIVHLLEAETEVLINVVKWQEKLMKLEPPPFAGMSVPVFTEENPKRIFKFWSSAVTPPDSTGENEPDEIQVDEVSWGLYSIIMEIGTKLSEKYSGDGENTTGISNAIKAITSTKKLLPKQETLSLMLKKDFPSLNDFIDIFVAPIDIVLDNEIIWPCPPELTF
jgi:hypothetical protein